MQKKVAFARKRDDSPARKLPRTPLMVLLPSRSDLPALALSRALLPSTELEALGEGIESPNVIPFSPAASVPLLERFS